MTCPHCHARTEVIDTDRRVPSRRSTIKRRRRCLGCGLRFNTVEKPVAGSAVAAEPC